MGTMNCRCGHVMRLTGADSPYEFSLVPEYVIERIAEKIGDGKMPSPEEFLDDIDRESIVVCRCIKCGRLYLDEKSWSDGGNEEEGTYLYERPEP